MTLVVTIDQLCISPFNVRRNAEDAEATDALQASIAARGLLFPLIIHDMAPFRDLAIPGEPVAAWGVLAGGRRLRALRCLIEAGRLKRDLPIETLVRDLSPAEITELSLSENLLRRDLRPYEVQAAIRDAQDQGATDEEIAANLGQRLDWVRRQLRLGRLVPEIFDAYVAGTINADQAQAFAATEDPELQRAAWEHFSGLRDWDRQPHRIRAWYKVGDHELERLLRFVGADAYRDAGGRFELDLFADGPERGRVVDEGMLRELAENKFANVRQDLRRRTGRSDLRFAAEPPQQHGSTDWSLAAEVRLGKAAKIVLPEGDIFATLDIDNAGDLEIRYWWSSRKARKDAMREASSNGVEITSAKPMTSFGHTIAEGEAFDTRADYGYAQAARQAVKDEHGLTSDGLQVMRSIRRELLRALLLADAMNDGDLGRDYLVWSTLRQELDNASRATQVGARGLASAWHGSEDAEPYDVVQPHLEQTHAREMWSATLEHLRCLPFMTIEDPAEAFSAFHFESDRVKRVAASTLAGLALLRSANVHGWRVATHDRIADILGADDRALRELWSPTPEFMALFPKLKRLELAQPHVEAEAFRDWHKQADRILTGATAGALEQAQGWVHPLLSFGVRIDEDMTAQCDPAEPAEVAE